MRRERNIGIPEPRGALARAWMLLRRLTGDDAYEQYLDHARRIHPSEPPLTRVAFEDARQQNKWNHTSRCC